MIVVLGSFVADLTFRAPGLPGWGETVLGTGFRISPGGKGSNQAVCAARLGAKVAFLTRLGNDAFAQLARATYKKEGIDVSYCTEDAGGSGAAAVVLSEAGENAIVVDPGSGLRMTLEDVERARPLIESAKVFVTGLEVPPEVAAHALEIAHRAGAITILNPAPVRPFPAAALAFCDWLTPNEYEAAGFTGDQVIVTLGARGARVRGQVVPAFDAGPVVETTGAGDAFTGAFAVGLLEGRDAVEAVRFACRVAGISVTRPGTSGSMPLRSEVGV